MASQNYPTNPTDAQPTTPSQMQLANQPQQFGQPGGQYGQPGGQFGQPGGQFGQPGVNNAAGQAAKCSMGVIIAIVACCCIVLIAIIIGLVVFFTRKAEDERKIQQFQDFTNNFPGPKPPQPW